MFKAVGHRYIFDTNTTQSGAFRSGFNQMSARLVQILEERNQTIVDLYRDLAIE